MRFLIVLFLSLLINYILIAQSPEVENLETKPNLPINGNLEDGIILPLAWATSSNMACFPSTRFNEFKGNHLFYRVQMPAGSKIDITVTPKNKKHRINVYALRLGANNMGTPPTLPSAISCEASYPIYAGKPNYGAPAKAQSIEYISIRKPYNILIGVAGAEGVLEGAFELDIQIRSR